MPQAVRTGLAFYRKKQSLESLASERPQSLQSVYSIVRNSVTNVQEHVASLEHAYYGSGGSLETEVRRWMPLINQVLRPAKFSDLISRHQLDAIAERVHDITDKLNIDQSVLNQVYCCVNKATSSVREGLAEDVAMLRKLADFMHTYCKSFCTADGESYLETATNYEKQRQDLAHAITVNLDNVMLMVDKFELETFKIHQFDFAMRDLGEKAGCSRAAVLLMFPAACYHVRNACKGLEMWVDADESYADYLRLDIGELAKRRTAVAKLAHEHLLAAGEHEHNLKSLTREAADCKMELGRLLPKQNALVIEETKLCEENHDVLVDLDIKEYRQQEMKQLGQEAADNALHLQRQVEELRARKPAIDRKLAELHKKQSVIADKIDKYQQTQKQLENARAQLRNLRRAARKTDVELEKVDVCLSRLREIIRLKTTTDTLTKIFHGMPATPRHSIPHRSKTNRKDPLNVLCHVVASTIDSDWTRLYQLLPFYPPRGQLIIQNDIHDICTRFLRHTTQEQAKQSLAKWRRLHTRACVEDLRSVIQSLRRLDVLERMDNALTPRFRSSVAPKQYRIVHFPRLMKLRTT